MGKIVKQKYTTADGTRKTYSYIIAIPKAKIAESNIDPDKEIKIKVESGKIIITN